MKNQYYGDINDFYKYALLLSLADISGTKLGINWYLTDGVDWHTNEGNNGDGNKTNYLHKDLDSFLNKPHDGSIAGLFENLKLQLVKKNKISIDGKTLNNAEKLFSPPFNIACYKERLDLIKDKSGRSSKWFEDSSDSMKDCNMVFVDPDNGISFDQALYDRGTRNNKDASKYVFPNEICQYYAKGERTVIIYQHGNRAVSAEELIISRSAMLSGITGCESIMSIQASGIVFFILPANNASDKIDEQLKAFVNIWKEGCKPVYRNLKLNLSGIDFKIIKEWKALCK